jgi:elongation factor P--(R)-beta-lysine ligase
MERTEQAISIAIQAVAAKTKVGGVEVSPPWERLTVREAFLRHAGIDLDASQTLAALAAAATTAGIQVGRDDGYDDVFFRILLERVEGKLGRGKPCFLCDYPASMAAMARRKPTEPAWAERVEVYFAGIELANGFTELSDAAEQRSRFLEERVLHAGREGVPEESLPLDEAFLAALPGLPLCTGIAIGLDRVLMLAMEKSSLAEVLAFPFGG